MDDNVIILWSSMRDRALSKTYECIQSFKHILKHFKRKELSTFIKNFKVPDYLYFSGLGCRSELSEFGELLKGGEKN
jgi:hypothetical protein